MLCHAVVTYRQGLKVSLKVSIVELWMWLTGLEIISYFHLSAEMICYRVVTWLMVKVGVHGVVSQFLPEFYQIW